jgi:hypothetical protein
VSFEYSEDVITFGMSCDELAMGLGEFMREATARVYGPGRDQYERPRDTKGVYQAFELMTPRELLQMAREEVQDLGVYAAMLDIRLARMARAFEINDTIGDAR